MRPLLLLAALLLALPPLAAAEGGITLTRLGASHVSTTIGTSAELDLGSSFTLDLDATQRLVLVSDVSGPSRAHVATWSIAGATQGQSNATDSASTPSAIGAGRHSLGVQWRLPADAPAGTYTFNVLVRHLPNVAQGAAGTTAGDTAALQVTLSRSAAATGAAGGGSLLASSLSALAVAQTEVTLAWQATPGAAGYALHRSLDPGFSPGPASLAAAPSGTSYTDHGLQPGTLYHYRLQAVDGSSLAGPPGPLLSVRTVAAPDNQAPTGAPTVQVGQVTATSVALSWTPVADGGPVSYEVFRVESSGRERRIASTANTFATDSGLQAGTTYSYKVRAVDAAGNAGPFSVLVGAATAASAAGDTTPPLVRAVAFRRTGSTLTATWQADEPGAGSILVTQGGSTRTVAAGQGTSFQADLGAVQGAFDYRIQVVDANGNAGTLAGRVDPGSAATSHRLAAGLGAAVAAVLGVSPDLYLVDRDGDGQAERILDGAGLVLTVHAAPATDVFVIEHGGILAVVRPRAEQAFPATLVQPLSVQSSESGAIRRLALTVEGDGWGVVDLPDTHVGLPVVSLRRADGSDVDLAHVWREDGRIRFVDELDSSYVLLLDTGVPQGEGRLESSDGGGLPIVLLVAGAAVALAVGLAIGFMVRRRRGA